MSIDTSLVCPCGERDYAFTYGGISHRNLPDYRYELHACKTCQLVRTLPIPRQDVYSLGDEATSARIDNEAIYRDAARSLLKTCKRYVASGTMLDVGCNIGLLVEEAAAAGYDAQGIDLDPAAVAHGRNQSRRLRCGSLQELAAEGAQFQLITVNHVLEHVLAIDAFLAELKRLLAPGGIILINVPNYAGLVPKLMKANWGALWPHQHVWQFTPTTLVATVERHAGVKLLELETATNLEPPSTPDLKGVLKQLVIGASVFLRQGDEIRSVFRRDD